MTPVRQAEDGVSAACRGLAAAEEAYRQAHAAAQQHREALTRAEADLAAHQGNGMGSVELLALQPEWRERRANLVAEIDDLRRRLAATTADVKFACDALPTRRAELRAAEQALSRARLRELIESGALEDPIKEILRAWSLYTAGYERGRDRDCPSSLGLWLFGRGGLYPIANSLKDINT